MSTILAVKINGRIANAPLVQEVLTKYGCNIKTRVGFHETNEDSCSTDGILILQLTGQENEIKAFTDELSKLNGVNLQLVEF